MLKFASTSALELPQIYFEMLGVHGPRVTYQQEKSTCHKQSTITSIIACFVCCNGLEILSGGRNVIAEMANSKNIALFVIVIFNLLCGVILFEVIQCYIHDSYNVRVFEGHCF